MKESILKGDLVKELRTIPKSVTLRHEDRFAHGHPDVSFTWNRLTFWIEVKFANPEFSSKGIQDLTMLRLSLYGLAAFVIYYQKDKEKRTYIVSPSVIDTPIKDWMYYADGFDHKFVVDWIKERTNEYYPVGS